MEPQRSIDPRRAQNTEESPPFGIESVAPSLNRIFPSEGV
jgi:hypothetical protein